MTNLSVLSLLAGATLFCAIPVSPQLSQGKLSVSFDSASAEAGDPLGNALTPGSDKLSVLFDSASAEATDPLAPGSVAGVHRRVERRAARRAYYGGYGYGGYAYDMATDGAVGPFAGGLYSVGGNYNEYPTRAVYIQVYVPPGYYGPVCNPRTDRFCQ